jgi:hypothetical protein
MPQSYLDSQSTYVDKDAMIGLNAVTATAADTLTLTAEDSGRIVFATKTSATQTFTLPAVAAGLNFTFCAQSAAGEMLINPTGSVVINTKAANAGAAVATAAGTGIKNTAATNVVGDFVTLVCDGTAWWTTNISGIFASQ